MIKIDIHTHKITLYPIPVPDAATYQATVDGEGIVWVVFTNADAVGRFDPRTAKWNWYDLPTIGTESHGLQVATVNGRTQVAIPYWGTNKIAKLELRTKEELAKLQVEVRGTANRR